MASVSLARWATSAACADVTAGRGPVAVLSPLGRLGNGVGSFGADFRKWMIEPRQDVCDHRGTFETSECAKAEAGGLRIAAASRRSECREVERCGGAPILRPQHAESSVELCVSTRRDEQHERVMTASVRRRSVVVGRCVRRAFASACEECRGAAARVTRIPSPDRGRCVPANPSRWPCASAPASAVGSPCAR